MSAAHPRPTGRLDALRQKAAAKMADALIEEGCIEADQRDDAIRDLAKYSRDHFDGYEFAKELDHSAMWDCNFQMAEILDNWSSWLGAIVRDAEREWAKTNGVQPPLPLGSHVSSGWQGEKGVIDGISQHDAAKYLIKVDGQKEDSPEYRSRRLVNFEDVRVTPAATSVSTEVA